jgi:hypothetical protein
MMLSVTACAIDGCGQLLYAFYEAQEQTLYCGKCNNWTILKKAGDDEDG